MPDQFCSRLFDILRQKFAALPTIFCWAMLRFTDILLEFCSALLRFVGTLPDAMASSIPSVIEENDGDTPPDESPANDRQAGFLAHFRSPKLSDFSRKRSVASNFSHGNPAKRSPGRSDHEGPSFVLAVFTCVVTCFNFCISFGLLLSHLLLRVSISP